MINICSLFVIAVCFAIAPDFTSEIKCSDKNNQLQEVEKIESLELADRDEPQFVGGPNYAQFTNVEYYQETTFDMKNYFQNLWEYAPSNSVGSCGFVSLISLMSYYDTFYNDNIIPDVYEDHNSTCQTEGEAKASSPGTVNEFYQSSPTYTYYDFCHDTQHYNLQSKLTVLRNIYISNTDNPTDFETSIGGWDFEDLFDHFYLNNEIDVEVTRWHTSNIDQNIATIKSIIDQGKPAIVDIKRIVPNNPENYYHSVVAYDYDENGIYANFGWGSTQTRSLLLGGSNGYNYIEDIFDLDFSSNQHVHSNNYVINNEGHCGCNLNDKVLIRNGSLFSNVSPTVYWMKDQYNPNEHYELYLRLDTSEHNFAYYYTYRNSITLKQEEWEYFLQFERGCTCFLLKRVTDDVDYEIKETQYIGLIQEAQSFTKRPETFGFPDAYCASPTIQQASIYDCIFTTRRLRCGYIHNEYLVLSPKRNGFGTAYLEFEFDDPIYKFEVDISFWGPNEGTNSVNSSALIQYKDLSGAYHDLIDLFYDIDLSRDRSSMDHLIFTFPEPTRCFRFYATAPAYGSSNKGRIAINDITVYGENIFVY